jgi:tetratricopeptide (TPR) repeat protein
MLDKALFVNGDKAAITGAGGIGKTQLALELAYRTREQYKSCAVLWIPAADIESLHQGYMHVAQRLGIPGWNNETSDVKRLVQHYLNQESAGQWMLLFDNADDISLWTAKPGSRAEAVGLMQYLPNSKQGYIVFTTRDTGTAMKLGAQNIEVPEMDQDIAQTLLQKCLTNRDLKKEQQEASLLLGKLNYLPLAITLAGAYININKTTTLQEYLSLLATQKDKSSGLLSDDVEDGPISRVDQQPLAVTWLISFEQICTQNQFAADCMSFMACIEQRDIPLSLLPTGALPREDAIKMLADYSMITRRPAGSALDMHQLVHLATQNWLQKEGQFIEWSERAIGQLEEAFPDGNHWNRNKWRRLLPHANYLLRTRATGEDNAARAPLIWKCAITLHHDGRYSEAEKLLVQVIETRKTKLGADHPDTLTSMANLGVTYSMQGRQDKAEPLKRQVMETRKTKLGADHPDTLISIANLASTYRDQGRWKEAEKLEVQVIETRRTKLGANHLDTPASMANLALTYSNQGR